MHILPTLFLISLLSGSLIRIPLFYTVTVYPHDIALFVYLLLWFIRRMTRKERIVFSSLTKPLGIFLGALLVSYLFNIFGHTPGECINGISYIIRILLYVGLYIVISNTENPFFWLKRLYGTGVIFGILGIVQYILYPDLRNLSYLGWDPHYYRLFSTFLDPNFAGIFLVLTFLLGLSFIFRRKDRLEYLLLQAIVLTALTLTLSRSSYIAFVASMIFYIWWKKSWKLLIGIVLCIALFLFIPLPKKDVTPIFREESANARISNWSYSIGLIKQAPVFGYGFNFLRTIQEPDYLRKADSQLSRATAGVDSSFLFVIVSSGLVGGAAFLYLLTSMWKLGSMLIINKKEKTLGLVYHISLIAIFIHSLFVNSFFYPWILIWLWIVTGVIEKKANA
jgi:O-antigen ligase